MKRTILVVLLAISVIINCFLFAILLRESSYLYGQIYAVKFWSEEISQSIRHEYLKGDIEDLSLTGIADSIEKLFVQADIQIEPFNNRFRVLSDSEAEIIEYLIDNPIASTPLEKEYAVEMAKFLTLVATKEHIDNSFMKSKFVYSMPYPITNDTLNVGEQYIAFIPYMIATPNYNPIVVVSGDTLQPASDKNFYFIETPKEKGLVEHNGFITFFSKGEIMKLEFDIRYLVK